MGVKHKYLDDIGVDYSQVWDKENSDRDERFEEQQRTYGFDERETWNLDGTFYMRLYERLKMYVEIGGKIVDLNYHKFTFKGKEYTQLEMINMMLERLEYYFNEDAIDDKIDEYRKQGMNILEADQKAYEPVIEIGEIWAIVLPAMWW